MNIKVKLELFLTENPQADKEFIKPSWRGGKSFREALSDPNVRGNIKNFVCTKKSKGDGLFWGSVDEEVNSCFDHLVSEQRLTDLGNPIYWYVLFFLVGVFLFAEIVITAASQIHINFKYWILGLNMALLLITISALCVLLTYYLSIAFKPSGRFLSFSPNRLHSIPLFILAIGLIVINFALVGSSGWSQSPFLPAYLCITLYTLSIPRENSRPVVIISSIAMFAMIVVFAIPLPKEDLNSYNISAELSLAFNVFTILFTGVTTIALRYWSSNKIPNESK